MTATASKPPRKRSKRATPLSLSALCKGILALDPHHVDVDALALIFGDAKVASLPALARLFGVQPMTVKGWRAAGMPGDPGAYVVRDVMAWLIQRNVREAARVSTTPNDPMKSRLREIEIEVAEIDLAKRRRIELMANNRLIDRHDAIAGFGSVLAYLTSQLQEIHELLSPHMPFDLARTLIPIIRREIDLSLYRAATVAPREIAEDQDLFIELLRERNERKGLPNHEFSGVGIYHPAGDDAAYGGESDADANGHAAAVDSAKSNGRAPRKARERPNPRDT